MTTRNPSGHWCQDETATVVNGKWRCNCPESAPRREASEVRDYTQAEHDTALSEAREWKVPL